MSRQKLRAKNPKPTAEDFETAKLYGAIGMSEQDLYLRIKVPASVYLNDSDWEPVRDEWRTWKFKRKESYCKADLALLSSLVNRINAGQPLEAWEIARIERAVDKFQDYEFRCARMMLIKEQAKLAKAKRELIEQQLEIAKNGGEQFIFAVEDLTQDDLDAINGKF